MCNFGQWLKLSFLQPEIQILNGLLQQAQPPPQPSLAYPQYPAQPPQQSSPYGGGYQPPYPPVGAGGPGYPPQAQVQPPAYPPSSTQGKECHYL